MSKFLIAAGIVGMSSLAMAQEKATEKVAIVITPPKTEPFIFTGYGIETINLITDRGVMIPWRVTMPR